MRKFTIYMLLAASAVPAMATAQDQGGRHGRQQSSEQSDNHSNDQRPARETRTDRAQQNEQRQQMQVQRQAQAQQMQAAQQSQMQQMQTARQAQVQQMQAAQAGERNRNFGGHRGEQDGQARDQQMQQYRQQMEARRAEMAGQQQGGQVERQGRYRSYPNAGQPAQGNRDPRYANRDRRDGSRWTSNWRNDNRYDWRRYRDQHRSIFQLGVYFDPFGYGYNRFGIGSYMDPGYYQSTYWINDPWQYRLPPAYGAYRWIRYHDDALMIDTWTGEVVDVIYGFFW